MLILPVLNLLPPRSLPTAWRADRVASAAADLYRAINAVLNPGTEIEIEFIRSDQGSIRATLRSIKKDAESILERPLSNLVFPFLVSIIANYVTSQDVKVIVKDDTHVVQSGTQQIPLPRDGEHKAAEAQRNPSVRRSVRNFFAVVESDPNITAVDFRSPRFPDQPVIPIERDKFAVLRDLPEIVDPELPKHKEETQLRQQVVVLTAVLEKSTKRKWQFLWNGIKIWADVHDMDFFSAPGGGNSRRTRDAGAGRISPVDARGVRPSQAIVRARAGDPREGARPGASRYGEQP